MSNHNITNINSKRDFSTASLWYILGIVGPIIVGITIYSFIVLLSRYCSISNDLTILFTTITTNTLFFSLLFCSVFTLPLNRYISDHRHNGNSENILSSIVVVMSLSTLIGVLFIVLLAGFFQVSLNATVAAVLYFIVFNSFWLLCSSANVMKFYKYLSYGMVFGLLFGLLLLLFFFVLHSLNLMIMFISMASVFLAIDCVVFIAFWRKLPKNNGSHFKCLEMFVRYPQLSIINFLNTLLLIGHFWIIWLFSDFSINIMNIFYYNPIYDTPVYTAFLCTIPTLIYYITSFSRSIDDIFFSSSLSLNTDCASVYKSAFKKISIPSIKNSIFKLAIVQTVSTIATLIIGYLLLYNCLGLVDDFTFQLFTKYCLAFSIYFVGYVFLGLILYLGDFVKPLFILIFSLITMIVLFYIESEHLSSNCFSYLFTCIVFFVSSFIVFVFTLRKFDYYLLGRQKVFGKPYSTIYYPDIKKSKSRSILLCLLIFVLSLIMILVGWNPFGI